MRNLRFQPGVEGRRWKEISFGVMDWSEIFWSRSDGRKLRQRSFDDVDESSLSIAEAIKIFFEVRRF